MIFPRSRMSTDVSVDFDGTLLSCDTTDPLRERVALGADSMPAHRHDRKARVCRSASEDAVGIADERLSG